MNRLVLSNGSYTSCLLSAILKGIIKKGDNNIFLAYFKKIKKNDLEEHFRIANSSFTFSTLLPLHLDNKNRLDSVIKIIRNKSIDEIYLPINSTTIKWYKIFTKIFPQAQFYFFEEGMISYIKPIFSRKLRKIMLKHTNYYVFYDSRLEQIMGYFCPNIPFSQIKKDQIIESLDNIYIKEKLHITFKNNSYAIVLPQYYYQNKPRKLKALLEEYKNSIRILLDMGNTVLFKDHPKAKYSFFTLLQKEINSDKFILLDNLKSYPIEIFIPYIKPKFVFSVYSTSLFTSSYLFACNTLSNYKMLQQRINWLSIFPSLTCLLTRKLINDINSKNTYKTFKVESTFKTGNKMLDLYVELLRKLL